MAIVNDVRGGSKIIQKLNTPSKALSNRSGRLFFGIYLFGALCKNPQIVFNVYFFYVPGAKAL
jgi:hypothetical protein